MLVLCLVGACQEIASALDERSINHVPVNKNRANAIPDSLLSSGDDLLSPSDFVCRWGKNLIGDRNLRRMDARLAAVSQLTCSEGFFPE